MNPTLASAAFLFAATTAAIPVDCRVQSEMGDLGTVVFVRSEHAVDVLFDGECYPEECIPVNCLSFFPNS
jgi:hypothetical protein